MTTSFRSAPAVLGYSLSSYIYVSKVKTARVEWSVTVQPVLSYNLISATVFKAARVFWWCSTDVVNKEIGTVANLNVDGPIAAVVIIVETDLPGDFPISHCGMNRV